MTIDEIKKLEGESAVRLLFRPQTPCTSTGGRKPCVFEIRWEYSDKPCELVRRMREAIEKAYAEDKIHLTYYKDLLSRCDNLKWMTGADAYSPMVTHNELRALHYTFNLVHIKWDIFPDGEIPLLTLASVLRVDDIDFDAIESAVAIVVTALRRGVRPDDEGILRDIARDALYALTKEV